MNVLFEDKHIIVCEKPAGIPTQAGKITEKDMVSEVNNYLRKAGDKSSAYLIHRLDKPVRGILVFAKTKEAAADLNRQLNIHENDEGFCKMYYAFVEGVPKEKEGILEDYMYKDGDRAVIVSGLDYSIKDSRGKAADIKLARLEYSIIEDDSTQMCKVNIKLLTGRFHQIRCQMANMGHPIVGDTLYGASMPYSKRKAIGLVAYSLSFNHPISKKRMTFTIDEK